MNEERKPVVAPDRVGAIAQFIRTLQLVWQLLNDPRVSLFPKLIIPAAIVYIISPFDFAPDFIMGLGQLDDIAIAMLSVALFLQFCPPDIVEEHRRAIAESAQSPHRSEESVIEGTCRVMPNDDAGAER